MNLPVESDSRSETRFDKGSWATLLLAFFILASWFVVTLRAISKPADGWAMTLLNTAGEHRPVFLGRQGAIGLLQEGDILVTIEGRPVQVILQEAFTGRPQLPAKWQVGEQVDYTILRDGQELSVAVPLYRLSIPAYFAPVIANPLDAIIWLLVWLIGPVVFWLRPRQPAARLLFLFSTSIFVGLMIEPATDSTASLFYRDIYWPGWLIYFSWQCLIIPTLLHFLLLFPVKKWFLQRYPRLMGAGLYGTGPFILTLFWLLNRSRPDSFFAAFNTLLSFQILAFLLFMLLAIIHSFRTVREPVARAQLRWITFGLLGGMGSGVLVWFVGEVVLHNRAVSSIAVLGFLFMPVCFSLAVLRYRLFDIDILINRTLVYGGLTAALALVYFGSVILLQTIFRLVTGEGQSEIVTVFSTLAIAALFTPLRRRIQAVIDRRFYRRRYNAAQTLANFGTAARDEVDLNQLTGRLLEAVEETMQPAHVSVWLKPAEKHRQG